MGGGREPAFGLKIEAGPHEFEGLRLSAGDNCENGEPTVRARHIRVGDAPFRGKPRQAKRITAANLS